METAFVSHAFRASGAEFGLDHSIAQNLELRPDAGADVGVVFDQKYSLGPWKRSLIASIELLINLKWYPWKVEGDGGPFTRCAVEGDMASSIALMKP